MVENKKLLELRNKNKKKKYTFVVKESKFSSGVKKRWRFPRGKHSKVRQMHKGRPALPGPGYGSPKAVKGLDTNGLRRVIVSNVKDLEKVNLQTDGAVIGANVGLRKKLNIVKKAQELGLKVLNVKDLATFVKGVEDQMASRAKKKKDITVSKAKKAQSTAKKAKEKEEQEKKEAAEEKKAEDKALATNKEEPKVEAKLKVEEKPKPEVKKEEAKVSGELKK